MGAPVVDFHGHWLPPALVDPAWGDAGMSAAARNLALLTDLDRQLELSAAAGTVLRVLTAPYSTIDGFSSRTGDDLVRRVNDELAGAVQRHPDSLRALATVDAFSGDAAADEARRAVEELGLSGLVLDAAQGELLLSDPQARPVLAYAAGEGIPVFAHPVTPEQLAPRFRRGGAGVLLARGTESALSTLTLLSSGALDELAGLELVVAGIAAAALVLSPFLDGPDDEAPLRSAGRGRLHVDTMGFDPAITRALIGVVGADHVLVGSDWPIMWRDASAERVESMLAQAGADPSEAHLISSGNALRLLGARVAA